MRLRSRDTERRLEQAARRRIAASPQLAAEYARLEPGRREARSEAIVLRGGIAVIAAACIGLAGFLGAHTLPGAVRIVLAIVNVIATIVSYFMAAGFVSSLRGGRDLAVLSQLPVRDADCVSLALRKTCYVFLLILPFWLTYYGWVAVAHGFQPSDTFAAVITAILQWEAMIALAALLSAIVPRWLDALFALVIFLAGLFATGATVAVLDANGLRLDPARVSGISFWLFPAGWVNAAFFHGVFRGQPGFWWLALPIVLMAFAVPAALGRVRRQYRVREIASGPTRAMFENEGFWRVNWGRLLRLRWPRHATAETDLEHPLAHPGSARVQVLSGAFLTPFDWARGGWIERAVGRLLNQQERDLALLLLAKHPSWTRNLKQAIACAACGSVLLLLPFPFNVIAAAIAGVGIVALASTGTSGAVVWKAVNGQQCPVIVPMPVGYREAMRVIMIVACVRGLFWLPLALGFGTLAGFAAGAPLTGTLIGAKVIAASVALQQWRFVEFAGMRDMSASWLAFRHYITLYITVMVLFWCFIFSAGGLPVPRLLSTPVAAVMFGSGWLAMRLDEWHFYHAASDLLARTRYSGITR